MRPINQQKGKTMSARSKILIAVALLLTGGAAAFWLYNRD